MSTLILNETFTNTTTGLPIDPTSVKLSDPGGVYGVKRNDTDAVVVADGTDMIKIAAGQYRYSFTQPAEGLTYTYWIEWVYSGETYWNERTVSGTVSTSFHTTARSMNKDEIVNWLKEEFKPLSVTPPTDTLRQIVDNAVRYWNTHSAYKICTMFDYSPGQVRVQLNAQFKSVVQVWPEATTTWIWNDHPLWTLLGITIIDNVTGDLILMSEAFRNYRVYVGTDMRHTFVKSEDPDVGGWLYITNLPKDSTKVAVAGTKRITAGEEITSDYILDWILRYSKSLLKQADGNVLRKSSIVNIKNDGQELVNEGKEEMVKLQEQLAEDGRWVAFAMRG